MVFGGRSQPCRECVCLSGFKSSDYNKIRAGQDAIGLSAKTVTRSHISQALNQKQLYSSRILISRAKVTEVFLHTIGVPEGRTALEE